VLAVFAPRKKTASPFSFSELFARGGGGYPPCPPLASACLPAWLMACLSSPPATRLQLRCAGLAPVRSPPSAAGMSAWSRSHASHGWTRLGQRVQVTGSRCAQRLRRSRHALVLYVAGLAARWPSVLAVIAAHRGLCFPICLSLWISTGALVSGLVRFPCCLPVLLLPLTSSY
jgi:hypothetical protein